MTGRPGFGTPKAVHEPEPAGWLLLLHHMPDKPAGGRVRVWRRLKALGTINIQPAVAMLPDTPEAVDAFTDLLHTIIDLRGDAQLLRTTTVAGASGLAHDLLAARNAEYAQLAEACRALLTLVPHQPRSVSTKELARLDGRFEAIIGRDFLGSAKRAEAEEQLDVCHRTLAQRSTRSLALARRAG